jgi:ribosomal protein S18 acetylase RimI-like enzyme
MNIRTALPAQDHQAVLRLSERFNPFGRHYSQVFTSMLAGEPILNQPTVDVANVAIFVAEIEDQAVVGFAAVEWREGLQAKLHGIAVDVEHEGKGVASQLLRHVIHQARLRAVEQLECITAETANPAALGFFTRHGFQNEGFTGRYPKGQRAIKLTRSLRTDPEPADPQPAAEQAEAAAEAAHAVWPTTPSYAAIKAQFHAAGRLQTITGSSAWTASQWPNVPGVYLVWHRVDPNPRQLLYIGKTGKFVREVDEPVHFNGGTLRSRLHRWTPYCFQRQGPYAQSFEYGPNFSVNVLPNQPYEDRYRHRVPAAEIEVECLLLEGWGNHLSPALLESMLLQDHMLNHGDLPPANNEF